MLQGCKTIRALLVFTLILSSSYLFGNKDLIRDNDVRIIMEELFSYHVEEQAMRPEIIKRSFQNYINHFDPLKVYLLEEEVSIYLNPSQAILEDAVVRYQKDDLYYYENIHRTIQKGILRARKWRKEMRPEMEQQAVSYQSVKIDLTRSFAAKSDELKNRQSSVILNAVNQQVALTPAPLNKQGRKQIFAFYEKRMREFEDLYLTVNLDNSVSQKEAMHFLALHTLKAMTTSLDSHSMIYSQAEANAVRASLKKGYYGIGIYLKRDVNGIFIDEIVEGGPAEKDGRIREDDKIIAIGNRDVVGLSAKEVLSLINSNENQPIKLSLQRHTQTGDLQTIEVNLMREKIILNDQRIDTSYEPFGDGIIGKITLYSFYDNQDGVSSAEDMRKAIEQFQKQGKLKGLVLDLRDNYGGYLSQAVEVAGLFISNGVIVISKYAQGNIQYFRDIDGRTYYDGPLVVLTSKKSASAAEIVAGALQDYGAAIVVGDVKTFGKGTMQYQNATRNTAKALFQVTVGRYYTVSGRSVQIDGVKADILIPTEYYDEQIGEEFVDFPLTKDNTTPAYKDSLKDLPEAYRDIFLKYYIPTLQEKKTVWTAMLPALKKNSEYRLSKNTDFQLFLEDIHSDGRVVKKKKVQVYEFFDQQEKNYGESDLQMSEAVHIVQDMVYIQDEQTLSSR